VRLPDGSFLASGGSNRGELYRLSADGGVAGSPLIRLDVPIFDLALDANGRLWATTGGGALLELDPASGAILAEHGDGITQALAIHPESGKIYVSTGGGVAIFDPATGIFEPSAKRASTTSRSRQPASCGVRPGPSAARSSSSARSVAGRRSFVSTPR
jgi:streptogramin lyase